MKILYLASNPTYRLNDNSGYATHMKGIINAFRNKGHRVETVIGGELEGDYNDTLKIGTTSRIKMFKKIIPQFLWQSGKQMTLLRHNKEILRKIIEIINEFNPDIIYERAEYLSNAGVKAGKKYNIPVFIESNAILEWEQTILGGFSALNLLGKIREKNTYKNCNHIFAISEPLKDKIVDNYKIDINKITVIPNGVEPEGFEPSINKKKMKSKLGISQENVVVGYVGSIFPWHGLGNLIDAAKLCLEEDNDLKFLIVGDGEETESLKEKAKRYKINKNVIFTGRVFRGEIPDYLQIMDICVYPGSKKFPERYGSPIKIFEYGVMGKPVILCRSRVTENIFNDLEDGYLIPPGSVVELLEAIIKLAGNPALRNKLGINFQKKVLENYTWDKIGEKILEVIRNEIRK